ncbi:MAG: SMC-Scp complex subunit ScpB [Candidatus Kerfeldbacteria bacterium]|nr:SMC-Scp complex subunit ScpB [Candidatus Kerfeldbacteria bacterium]
MNNLDRTLESLLFVATRPLTTRRLAELCRSDQEAVKAAVHRLVQKFNHDQSGLNILEHGQTVQMVSTPFASQTVTEFLKEEQAGELTRPSLETLTIIAYRGPISKIQLDTIRGVNCALILRNLMVKGLVEAKAHRDRMQTSYQVSTDFVRHLGLTNISSLPEYARLHQEDILNQLINPGGDATTTEETAASAPTI